MYSEDDYLQLSGIQHFVFCRRQWALIHIEQLWEENRLTVEGQLMHEKTHNPFSSEKRKDIIVVRDMAIHSTELGISGKCDTVEFLRDDKNGIKLFGRSGLWSPQIVEYKHGKPKVSDCDRFQLTLQAICLEEMLCCQKIEKSCLYYGETKHREYVELTDEMRDRVKEMIVEMHDYYKRRYTPLVKTTKSCTNCSLNEFCLPKMGSSSRVAKYIESALLEEESI